MTKVIDSNKGKVNVFADGSFMKSPFTKDAWSEDNIGTTMSGIGSGLSYLSDNVNNVKSQASIDTERFDSFKNDADRMAKTQFAVGDNDVLMNQASALQQLNPLKAKDLRGNSIMKDLAVGWGQGLKGFMTGMSMSGNPLVGGIMGAAANMSSDIGTVVGRIRAKRKAKESEDIAANAQTIQQANYNNAVQTTDRMNDFTALQEFIGAYGGYKEGQEYDLDESEVKRLIDSGYQIEYI